MSPPDEQLAFPGALHSRYAHSAARSLCAFVFIHGLLSRAFKIPLTPRARQCQGLISRHATADWTGALGCKCKRAAEGDRCCGPPIRAMHARLRGFMTAKNASGSITRSFSARERCDPKMGVACPRELNQA